MASVTITEGLGWWEKGGAKWWLEVLLLGFLFFSLWIVGTENQSPRGSCKYKAVDAVGVKNSVVEMSVSIMYLSISSQWFVMFSQVLTYTFILNIKWKALDMFYFSLIY